MEKILVYLFSDNYDVENIVMEELSGCITWIEGDLEGLDEEDASNRVYTIVPAYMTQDEIDNLPEAE